MKKITLLVFVFAVVATSAAAENMSQEEANQLYIIGQQQQIINNQRYEQRQRDRAERAMLMQDKRIIEQWKAARRAGRWKEVEGYEVYLRGRGYNP